MNTRVSEVKVLVLNFDPIVAAPAKTRLHEHCRWRQPDGADYPQVLAKHRIAQRIDNGEIDEVWWFGGPYFGFFESAMAGRGHPAR